MRSPVTGALGHQPGQKAVGGVEDLGILHADGGQLVDVEEAPVVDLLAGHAPVGQPIELLVEQGIEEVEGAGVVRRCR